MDIVAVDGEIHNIDLSKYDIINSSCDYYNACFQNGVAIVHYSVDFLLTVDGEVIKPWIAI